MCGIVGTVPAPDEREDTTHSREAAALDCLAHRGPDARGSWRDGRLWLGHRRLAILDLSAAGNQPMASEDGRYVLVYNGEIFNHRELAAAHGLDGLRTRTDSEVVLRLFAVRGVDSFRLLNGQFALAIYDRVAGTLWLARDRLGIKPLYYRHAAGALAFASEMKALHALDGRVPECDASQLHAWLYYGTTLGGATLVRGIRQLPPGHALEFDLGQRRATERCYWSLAEQAAEPLDATARDAAATVRELLERAVARQLMGDVPVGVFLSGGVDSTAITAFAARHQVPRLATFAAGFDFEPRGGALPAARRMAARFGTEHHEIRVAGSNLGDAVEALVGCHDQPFADPANIPLKLMADQLGGRIKVILQGDGGDELFGGYRRYTTLSLGRAIGPAARLLGLAGRVLPQSPLRQRLRRYGGALGESDPALRVARLLTAEDPATEPAAIFGDALRSKVEADDPFAHHVAAWRAFAGQDARSHLSLVDLAVTLPDVFLEKVDRSTMSASIEVRVPFLDHDLVDYAIRLPGSIRMPWGQRKGLLKDALAGVVPDEVLRAPKSGLTVPVGEWLRGPLRERFLDRLDAFTRRHPDVLARGRVMDLFGEHATRRRSHAPLLWKVLNLMVWAENSRVRFTPPTT